MSIISNTDKIQRSYSGDQNAWRVLTIDADGNIVTANVTDGTDYKLTTSDVDNEQLLKEILLQLKIMNRHLFEITNERINEEEV